MPDAPTPSIQNCAYGPQLRDALDRIKGLVVDGLQHGLFEYSLACEIGKDGRRQLLNRAGKRHKLAVPEGDLRRCDGDPCDGDAAGAKARSSVIGGIPRPETRSAERRRADRESSVKLSEPANGNLINQTIGLWQSR